MLRALVAKIKKTVVSILIWALRFYQVAISPGLLNRCRFYPSCSEYAKHAFLERGVVLGFILTFKRLCRCHPFCKGGVDALPQGNGSNLAK